MDEEKRGSRQEESALSDNTESRPLIYLAWFFEFSFLIVDHMAPGACHSFIEAQKGKQLPVLLGGSLDFESPHMPHQP